ncbi:MAG: endolytic transglycosylase MltG [Candidatus Neomarinimicrobiota bacterium]
MWRDFFKLSSSKWLTAIILTATITFLAFRHLLMSWSVPTIYRDQVTIPEGASAYKVANLLHDRGLISNRGVFVNTVRMQFGNRSLRPGIFLLLNVRHMGDLVGQLVDPGRNQVWVTIREGLTRGEIGRFIAAKYPISVARFMALSEDPSFIRELDIEATTLEGYLFPDTYRILNGSTEETILAMLVDQNRQVLTDDVLKRGTVLGLSRHEILTMASIIEGETRIDSERVIVSAVYHNRLQRGMRLQADPTIQFVLPDGPRRLLYSDYDYPSEYNTYLHRGLPPGPVNNPGRAAILATVKPAAVDFLYFVADGNGGHIFTSKLEEHKQVIQSLR